MLDQSAADRLRRQLRDLPGLYVYAHLALQPGAAPSGGRVTGGTRTPPLPCRLDLLSHLGPGSLTAGEEDGALPVVPLLSAWAAYFAGQRQEHVPGSNVQKLSHFLLRHHRWAVQQDWAHDYAEQVDAAVRPLYAVGPTDLPASRRRTIPCPACHRLSLLEEFRPVRHVTEPDRARIVCSRPECSAALTAAEYDHLAGAVGAAIEAGAA